MKFYLKLTRHPQKPTAVIIELQKIDKPSVGIMLASLSFLHLKCILIILQDYR